ncbi:MAG: complex I subunit 5 family protein [Erysipelotrichaceae bacterium]|nr:complex I subunit 5 family protein [Erysipelotrichaceae bacterium]
MNTVLLVTTVFFPLIASFISYGIGRKNKKLRNYFAMAVTIVTLLACFALIGTDTTVTIPDVCGMQLSFVASGLHQVLACIACFIWMMTTIFSDEYFAHYRNRNRYYFFMLASLGATLGVFLSADFFTTFFFFEIMSFTSFVLVIHDESETALKAAKTYLAVAVIGGLVTLMGMFMLYAKTNTLVFTELVNIIQTATNPNEYYLIGILILVGFAAKAGLFPLHIWLPEAHPAAPAPASALLSCILTKSGIFGVIMLSCSVFLHDANWGMMILIFGVITMVLGAVLAVFSINLKRTLACSSLSQIGFITVAIGMMNLLGEHNTLAAQGAILHILNHGLLKLVLFMSAGVIYMNLHQLDLNAIRGYGKNKKLLKGIFLMGVLGISGIPLWNGYISKTLIHESIVEMIDLLLETGQSAIFFQVVEALFLFAGGLTIAYMTKLFVAIFMEDSTNQAKMDECGSMNRLSTFTLVVPAALLFILGVLPHQTMDVIANFTLHTMNVHPATHAVAYFSLVNLKGAIISLCVGAIVYFGFIRTVLMRKQADGTKVYVDVWPKWLNLENGVYRPLLLHILPFIGALFSRLIASVTEWILSFLKFAIFNQDNTKVIPPEDDKITIATLDPDRAQSINLAKSLVYFGLGMTITILYLIF